MVLTYHSVGIPAMMGIALILSSFELSKLRKRNVVTLLLPLIILLLIAQARQAIFGIFHNLVYPLDYRYQNITYKKIWVFCKIGFCFFTYSYKSKV